jgi:hypothetical protein
MDIPFWNCRGIKPVREAKWETGFGIATDGAASA